MLSFQIIACVEENRAYSKVKIGLLFLCKSNNVAL